MFRVWPMRLNNRLGLFGLFVGQRNLQEAAYDRSY